MQAVNYIPIICRPRCVKRAFFSGSQLDPLGSTNMLEAGVCSTVKTLFRVHSMQGTCHRCKKTRLFSVDVFKKIFFQRFLILETSEQNLKWYFNDIWHRLLDYLKSTDGQ